MKLKIVLVLIFSLIGLNSMFSQTNSPVGKWTLSEYQVYDTYDSLNQYWTPRNLYSNQFEAYLLFKPNGDFLQVLPDTTINGYWTLTRKGKKLKIKCGRFDSYVTIHRKTFHDKSFNFELPLYYSSSNLKHLFEKPKVKYPGEIQSIYTKVYGKPAEIDSSLLFGKWQLYQTSHKSDTFNRDKNNWSFTFHEDGTYEEKYNIDGFPKTNTTGIWKITERNLILNSDDTENTFTYPHVIAIEELTTNKFVYSGYEGRKMLLFFYLHRVE